MNFAWNSDLHYVDKAAARCATTSGSEVSLAASWTEFRYDGARTCIIGSASASEYRSHTDASACSPCSCSYGSASSTREAEEPDLVSACVGL